MASYLHGLGCLLCFSLASALHAKPADLPMADGVICEGRDRPQEVEGANDHELVEDQARRLYEIAECCRRHGDLVTARTCYEQVHLLSPTSRHGQLAIERLSDLEQVRDSEEEQEQPAPQSTRPEPRKINAVPLGVVERVY